MITSLSGKRLNQFSDRPNVIREVCSHRGRRSQCTRPTAEVVPAEVQCDCGLVVAQRLAEPVHEPGGSPNPHSHGQILPLDARCADPLRVRVSHDGDHLRIDHFCRRIPHLALTRAAIDLDELLIVRAITQARIHSVHVGLEAVRSELEVAVSRRLAQSVDDQNCS